MPRKRTARPSPPTRRAVQKAKPPARPDVPATPQRARVNTRAQQKAFLEQYKSVGIITAAARLVGIDRQRHYEWLDQPTKYPTYQALFESAHEEACDRLETEALRRAVQGWDEPVFGKGPGQHAGTVVVGAVRKYSDRMLELLLKARRPEKFKERFEHTGKGGGPIESKVTFYIPDNGRRA